MIEIPSYFFRTRENGAVVFRVDTENRHQRIEMVQIATLNVKNGEVKPHGDQTLTDSDRREIDRWMEERRDLLRHRQTDDILRTVDHLNLTAQWALSKASNEDLDKVTDALLMAMHDLRSVLIHKKANQSNNK